jgi:hypothetical protein
MESNPRDVEPDEETLLRLIEKREKNLKRCNEKILYYTSQVGFATDWIFFVCYLAINLLLTAYDVCISGAIWLEKLILFRGGLLAYLNE